ncbi:MAG: 5'-nucleotidase C-terminal domain-containing protein [Proteobacteria bacterium]|nr:5'-nucleotidase C-terminal domain-containing protein [Pseudomonadota bacterium]
MNGVKIGIIGANTTATPTQTVAANVEGLKFGKFIDHVPFEAERLRREDGVSFVILLTHAGGDCDMTLDSRDGDKACQDLSLSAGTGVVADEVTEFIRQLPLRNSDGGPNLLATVDAVFAGHRHRPQAHFVSNIDTATKTPPLGVKLTVPVLQITGFGKSFSMLDVTFNRNSSPLDSLQTRVSAFKIHKPTYLCYEHFENLKDCNPELESVFKGQYPNNFGGKESPKFRGQSLSLSNLIDDQTNLASGDEKQALSPFLDIISKSFGNIDRVVVKELPNALSQDRTRESKMANCVVDTVLDQYNEKKLPSEKVDLMIMNSSAIRDQLNAGRITFEMLFAISPFSAKLSVMKLTRDELEALGRSLSKNLPNSVAVISKGWQVTLAKDKNTSPNHIAFVPPEAIRNQESFTVLTNDFNALPNGPHEAVLGPIRSKIQILDLDLLAFLEAGLRKQPLLESCAGLGTNRTVFATN